MIFGSPRRFFIFWQVEPSFSIQCLVFGRADTVWLPAWQAECPRVCDERWLRSPAAGTLRGDCRELIPHLSAAAIARPFTIRGGCAEAGGEDVKLTSGQNALQALGRRDLREFPSHGL